MQSVLLGDLTATTATLATLRTEVLNTDTGTTFPMTAPDQLAVNGRLPSGAVASMHLRGGAHRTTPFLWEIDGTHGSLRITGDRGLPMSATLTVEGAYDHQQFSTLEPPTGYDRFPVLAGTPAHNVAHLYAQIAEALAGRPSNAPSFGYGAELHRTLEAIVASAEPGGHQPQEPPSPES